MIRNEIKLKRKWFDNVSNISWNGKFIIEIKINFKSICTNWGQSNFNEEKKKKKNLWKYRSKLHGIIEFFPLSFNFISFIRDISNFMYYQRNGQAWRINIGPGLTCLYWLCQLLRLNYSSIGAASCSPNNFASRRVKLR